MGEWARLWLNSNVARHSRPSGSPRRKSDGGGFHWLGVILALGLLGWIWWRSVQPAEQSPKPDRLVPAKNLPVASVPVTRKTLKPTNITEIPKPVVPPTNQPPRPLIAEATNTAPHPVLNVLEAQIALARRGISSGSLDGVLGSQTRAAIRVFQAEEHLPSTGQLDADTRLHLNISPPVLTNYTVTIDDLDRLHPVPRTWLGKSQADRLDYETILELVAEKFHAHPDLIRQLNPDLNWNGIKAGVVVQGPSMEYPPPRSKAAFIKIHLADKTLEAFDARTNILVHFPCSIAAQVEKRPVGQLSVVAIVHNPSYVFNPDVFPESEEGRILGRKLVLPTGPNNPVGTAWIGLNRPGYGIHGTPKPEEVGRTESHGCFRLANWNAEYLTQLVSVGTPVVVER